MVYFNLNYQGNEGKNGKRQRCKKRGKEAKAKQEAKGFRNTRPQVMISAKAKEIYRKNCHPGLDPGSSSDKFDLLFEQNFIGGVIVGY